MSLFGGDSPSPRGSPSASQSSFSVTSISAPDDNTYQNSAVEAIEISDNETSSISEFSDSDSGSAEGGLSAEQDSIGRARFAGSDRLWRRYAKNEMVLAKSLDDERGADLAAHLYNTHAWKQALRDSDAVARSEQYDRKSTWVRRNSDNTKPWIPQSGWTTWPLEPHELSDGRDKSIDKHLSNGQISATSNLINELTGVAMRHIKHQWSARLTDSTATDGRAGSRPPSRPPSRSQSRARSLSRTPSVAAKSREATPVKLDSPLGAIPDGSMPVLSADEDRSRAYLRPLVASVVTCLEDLLMGLHHNRVGHYLHANDEHSIRSRTSSHNRSRSRASASRTPRRLHSERLDSNANSNDEDERPPKRQRMDSAGRQTSATRGRNRSRRHSDFSLASSDSTPDDPFHRNPRDWSEVVGIAGLTDWPDSVIQRTTERCSNLFNETMEFGDAEDAGDLEPSKQSDELDSAAYFCPELDCDRHRKSFPRSQGFRFREHLSRVHGYSPEEAQGCLDTRAPSSPGPRGIRNNPRGWVPPEPLSCPVTGCKQNSRVYDEPRRLIEHLTRTHKYDPRLQSPPPELAMQDSEHATHGRNDDCLVAGVHNDGFLEQV